HNQLQALDANGPSALVGRALVGIRNLCPLVCPAVVSEMNSSSRADLAERRVALDLEPTSVAKELFRPDLIVNDSRAVQHEPHSRDHRRWPGDVIDRRLEVANPFLQHFS